MRACPFPCDGYQPDPEAQRQEQEVRLLGANKWTGRTCPGAVIAGDRVVADLLRDYQVLDRWAHGHTLDWWDSQPAWWTTGMREIQSMRDTIENEMLKKVDRDAG
jgi:hypothetical protein